MPFTHDRPSQGRHTAIAYSVKLDGVRTLDVQRKMVAFSDDTDNLRRTESTSSVGTGDGYILSANSSYSTRSGQTETGSGRSNYSGTTKFESYSKYLTRPGNFSTTNAEVSDAGTTTGFYLTTRSQSKSKSNSVKRAAAVGTTNRINVGAGSSSYFTLYAQGATAGVKKTIVNSTASTNDISKRNGLPDTTFTDTFEDISSDETTVTRRATGFNYTIKTSLSITTRNRRPQNTYNTTISTYFPGVGSTEISTTGVSSETSFNEFSFADYVTGNYAVAVEARSTYNVSSIHGGAFWAKGGTRLSNDFIVGAQSTTVLSGYENQLPFNQQFSYDAIYTGEPSTISLTDIVNVTTNSEDQTLTVETVELTKMAASSTNAPNFVDFNIESQEAIIFTTATYSQAFQLPTTTTGTGFTTEESTFEVVGKITSQCESILNSSTVNFSKTYSGESGMEEVAFSSLGTSVGTGRVEFQLTREDDETEGKSFSISSVSPEDLLRSTAYGIGQKSPTRNIITYDKGLQGGVQYETNNNISAAIREGKDVTISHAYITTTATTSKNAFGSTTSQINVTINTSISGTYLSSNFPLTFRGQLNKYAPFLPSGSYGDIYYSSPSVYVHLDHSQNGSSIIKCTRGFTYNTSKSDSSISTTLDTTLYGVFKVENGGGGANYQKTKMYAGVLNPGGGGDFTNRNGAVVNVNAPPATYYAFGSNGSTQVDEGLTQVGDGNNFVTKQIPANAMIFMHESMQAFADSGPGVFDRKQ